MTKNGRFGGGARLLRARRWLPLAAVVVLAGAAAAAPASAATGLAFLKNGVDARAALLGQAVASNVADASAAYWNPAGLARMSRPELFLTHIESFADLRQEFGSVTQPVGGATAALMFNGMWSDDIDGYDRSANPTGAIGWSAYEAGVALGREVSPGLALGASVNYLREAIGPYVATGWAGGAGAQWAPWPERPVRFGLAVRNFGPAMKFIEDDFDLPLTIQGGVSWKYHPNGSSSALLVSTEVRSMRDEDTALLLGAEYGFEELLSFGMGLATGHDTRGLSFGIGAHPGRWGLYWAYAPIRDDLGDEHRFSLQVKL